MKLSIIIPTFNRLELLQDAIRSVLDLEVIDTEIIVCDDASTDGTGKWIETLSVNHPTVQVVYLRLADRSGAPAARNLGLLSATGDLVMFMDSDDVLEPVGVCSLLDVISEQQSIDYVYGEVVQCDMNFKRLDHHVSVGEIFDSRHLSIYGYHWHTMGAIYRRRFLLSSVGLWNEDLTGSQDWEYQARVKIAGGKSMFLRHTVGYWRDHESSRVGTTRFREDYAESVILACMSIQGEVLKKYSQIDKALEKKLLNKALLHVLELSAHGSTVNRDIYLNKLIKTAQHNSLTTYIMRFMCLIGSRLDLIAWKAIKF